MTSVVGRHSSSMLRCETRVRAPPRHLGGTMAMHTQIGLCVPGSQVRRHARQSPMHKLMVSAACLNMETLLLHKFRELEMRFMGGTAGKTSAYIMLLSIQTMPQGPCRPAYCMLPRCHIQTQLESAPTPGHLASHMSDDLGFETNPHKHKTGHTLCGLRSGFPPKQAVQGRRAHCTRVDVGATLSPSVCEGAPYVNC